jgi:hypothetical protein
MMQLSFPLPAAKQPAIRLLSDGRDPGEVQHLFQQLLLYAIPEGTWALYLTGMCLLTMKKLHSFEHRPDGATYVTQRQVSMTIRCGIFIN